MIQISKDIQKAAAILSDGGQVAIPTETVYGLAANIFDENAIKGIFEKKKRPLVNPLIVHIKSREYLSEIVDYVPQKANQLADTFWPGPLTLVLQKKTIIPDLITAGKDTVGVRIPNHPLTLQLLNSLDFPLAAPSANPSGRISPTSAQHVAYYFENELEMVLDGGPCQRGIESTIIGFEGDEPILYRLGSISKDDIESAIGPVKTKMQDNSAPNAPGMLSRHYAPKTKTHLVDDVAAFVKSHQAESIGAITFQNAVKSSNIEKCIVLSENGSFEEAASQLYASMHQLDQLDLDIIVAERLPNEGVGKSINDRLARATKSE